MPAQWFVGGIGDVDLETPLGTADIISGAVRLSLEMNASASQVSLKGTS